MPEPSGNASVAISQAVPPVSFRRRATNHLMTGLAVSTVILVLAPLIAIFGYLVYKGFGSVDWAFLTQIPKPEGEPGGGMANGIVGSIAILGVASLIGVPFGVGAGIYLAEFGRNRLGTAIRFTADVLNGVPSIVIGIVAWAILVRGHGFSAVAGGVALAIMMVPTITRTTEEMLLLVPQSLREARVWVGSAALAHDAFDHFAHRDFGRDYRNHAGLRPGCGRNGSAAVHCPGQRILEWTSALERALAAPGLEPRPGSADGGFTAADLQVCDVSV